MNISGMVIHALPENAVALQKQMAALAGVEIHSVQQDGRMVITIEDSPKTAPAETLMRVQNLPGVLSAAMIYNYCDEE